MRLARAARPASKCPSCRSISTAASPRCRAASTRPSRISSRDCWKPAQLDGKEDSQVTVVVGGQPRPFKAQNYLYHLAMPNFYFHITTAYNLLRQLGVEIGKRDFMGPPPA